MEPEDIEPKFNFPYLLQFRHNGRWGKRRNLFNDYGVTSMIDVGNGGEILSQRVKGDNFTKYQAVNPVLPLSETAETIPLYTEDKIMGHIIMKNKKLKKFLQRVQNMYSNGKRLGKIEPLKDILSMSRELMSNFRDDQVDINETMIDDFVDEKVPGWFRDMFKHYTQIEGYIPKYHNCLYEGGCIDTIAIDNTHCYTVSAARKQFNHLRLTFVSKKSEGLLQSYISEELKLPSAIYKVKTRKVQGEDYITVLTENQCLLYNFRPESKLSKLLLVGEPLNQHYQSIDVSPYIPGECVLVDDKGQCHLWSDGCLDTISAHGEPRFDVGENWRHVQYGSHPRHLIYADQTAVQMFDLRVTRGEGVDLFSLPSELLYNRERIRACSRHPASPFYHLVATDYKLLMMDERYQKYPVLRWEHMLTSPPQYISNVSEADDNFIYIGSQYSADVHAFRFSAHNGQPPLSVGQPYKASRIVDIAKWPQYLDNCPNVDILTNRLDTSLAGIAVTPWQQGHVIFQMDSYGEIFHQVFSSKCQSSADVTFSAGFGSCDLKPSSSAVDRAQCWIGSWGEMMKRQMANNLKTRKIDTALLAVFHRSDPHESCCVCHPDLIHIPRNEEEVPEYGYCYTCLVKLRDGQKFVKSLQKDSVVAVTSGLRPLSLKEVNEVPTDSALSELLMKDWYGDEDCHTMEDIMNHWDNEVKEMRSAKKNDRSRCLPDMSEESVLDRLQSRSVGQTGSKQSNLHAESDMENTEPSISSGTDGLDQGQRSRKRRHSATSSQTSGRKTLSKSAQKSQKKGSSDKSYERKGRQSGSSVNSDSIVITADDDSLVVGSSLSEMSEIFPLVDKYYSSTSVQRKSSVFGSQQMKHTSNKSQKQITPSASQSQKCKSSVGSKTHSEQNNTTSLFTSQTSQGHINSSEFKIPISPAKRKSSKRDRKPSPSGSSITVRTASDCDISINTGSEDLFDSPENTGDSDAGLSSEFSVASYGGLFKSQLSQKPVARQLFSGEKSESNGVNTTLNSANDNSYLGISPRKPSQRKHLSGF